MQQGPVFPSQVDAYFAEERRKQQQWTSISQIQANVNQARSGMERAMQKLAERGQSVEEAQEQAHFLEQSSAAFYAETLPPWRRYLWSWLPPRWWWLRLGCTCCEKEKEESSSEEEGGGEV